MTGGAGFIGSNFVLRTLAFRPNLEIVVLDSLTYAGKKSNLKAVLNEIDFVHGDVRDADLVDRLTSKADIVLNFAAESHNDNSLRNPSIFFETNVMGTLNLARSCSSHGAHLHHVSTDEVFGDLPISSEEEFTVNSPYKPSSPYSASKASSDHVVRAFGRSFGLQYTISNCSNNYGPNQHAEKLIPATIHATLAARRPRVYGSGKNIRDWIHVYDHIDAIWTILDSSNPYSKTFLIGSRDRVSNLELVTSILQSAGYDDEFIEFVEDRPGHDLRYAIDPSSIEELGWKPKFASILSQVDSLYELYRGEQDQKSARSSHSN